MRLKKECVWNYLYHLPNLVLNNTWKNHREINLIHVIKICLLILTSNVIVYQYLLRKSLGRREAIILLIYGLTTKYYKENRLFLTNIWGLQKLLLRPVSFLSIYFHNLEMWSLITPVLKSLMVYHLSSQSTLLYLIVTLQNLKKLIKTNICFTRIFLWK